MCLPKTKRVLKKLEFKKILDEGFKVVSKEFVVFAVCSGKSRLGIIASRKVGNAVARNRAKRLIREAYRQQAYFDQWEVVVIARKNLLFSNFEQVQEAFNKCYARLVKFSELKRK